MLINTQEYLLFQYHIPSNDDYMKLCHLNYKAMFLLTTTTHVTCSLDPSKNVFFCRKLLKMFAMTSDRFNQYLTNSFTQSSQKSFENDWFRIFLIHVRPSTPVPTWFTMEVSSEAISLNVLLLIHSVILFACLQIQ